MPHRDSEVWNQIIDAVRKLAREIALAQPGQDAGLLPINCLLNELREAAPKLPEIGRAHV